MVRAKGKNKSVRDFGNRRDEIMSEFKDGNLSEDEAFKKLKDMRSSDKDKRDLID